MAGGSKVESCQQGRDGGLHSVGCARPLEDAMRTAFEEMVYWLNADYGLSYEEAYMLLGQVAEARCTQMVNPKYSYICKVSKEVLKQLD